VPSSQVMLVIVLSSQCCQWHYRGNVARGVMSLPSHIGDGIAESLPIARCRCRVLLVMVRWHRRGDVSRGAMSLPSLAGDGTAKEKLVVA
jgi:hypothetical protein